MIVGWQMRMPSTWRTTTDQTMHRMLLVIALGSSCCASCARTLFQFYSFSIVARSFFFFRLGIWDPCGDSDELDASCHGDARMSTHKIAKHQSLSRQLATALGHTATRYRLLAATLKSSTATRRGATRSWSMVRHACLSVRCPRQASGHTGPHRTKRWSRFP